MKKQIGTVLWEMQNAPKEHIPAITALAEYLLYMGIPAVSDNEMLEQISEVLRMAKSSEVSGNELTVEIERMVLHGKNISDITCDVTRAVRDFVSGGDMREHIYYIYGNSLTAITTKAFNLSVSIRVADSMRRRKKKLDRDEVKEEIMAATLTRIMKEITRMQQCLVDNEPYTVSVSEAALWHCDLFKDVFDYNHTLITIGYFAN